MFVRNPYLSLNQLDYLVADQSIDNHEIGWVGEYAIGREGEEVGGAGAGAEKGYGCAVGEGGG
eukprot:scaffold5368_cov206-Alexandrium_tamarense.AAC.8